MTGYGGIQPSACQSKGCCYKPAPATTGAALLTLPVCFYPNGEDSSFSLSGGLQATGAALNLVLQSAPMQHPGHDSQSLRAPTCSVLPAARRTDRMVLLRQSRIEPCQTLTCVMWEYSRNSWPSLSYAQNRLSTDWEPQQRGVHAATIWPRCVALECGHSIHHLQHCARQNRCPWQMGGPSFPVQCHSPIW